MWGLSFLRTAYQTMTHYSGALVQGGVALGAGLTLVYLSKNRNLKLSQKIIPISGVAAAGATAVPAGISLALDATDYIPLSMSIASIAGVLNDGTLCVQERSELNNLLRETKSKAQLKKEIQLDLSLKPEEKNIILQNVFKPEKIFTLLYRLRREIIKSKEMESEQKQNLVLKINSYIEQMSTGKEVVNIDLTDENLSEEEHEDLYQLKALLSQYNEAKALLIKKEIILPDSLKKSLLDYTNTQSKIYAQFLPYKVKKQIVRLIEGATLDVQALNALYQQMGDHFRKCHKSQIEQIDKQTALGGEASPKGYPVPHIKLTDSGNDLIMVMDKIIDSTPIIGDVRKVRKELQSEGLEIVIEIKDNAMSAIIGEEEVARKAARKAQKQALKDEFKDCYEATLNIVEKAGRLNFLKQSYPRHRINFLLDLGCAATSFALTMGFDQSSVLQMALYGTGTVFTLLSVANGLTLAIKESKQDKQFKTARTKLEQTILQPNKTPKIIEEPKSWGSYVPGWSYWRGQPATPATSAKNDVSNVKKPIYASAPRVDKA